MSVVSVLQLPVRADARAEFERAFHELGVFERSRESGGFVGGRVLRPLGDDGGYVVIAEWESADDYRGWLENPVRAELSAGIDHLLAGEVVAGRIFEDVEEAR